MIPGGPSDSYSLSDYALGARIGTLIAAQGGADFNAAPIFSQIQDLLGADIALLSPLRDLLLRPAFRQLVGGSQGALQLGSREALLQDLQATYNPAVLRRLSAVIDGCLGLPASAPFVQPSTADAEAPAPAAVLATARPPLTVLLILLASLLAGGLVIAPGLLLLAKRTAVPSQPQRPASSAQPAVSGSSAAPVSPKAVQPADSTPTPDATPNGAAGAPWGAASEYKFGRLPGGDYPNSCAFSQTDAEGKIATDKTAVEFWACRDLGGDPQRGYSVAWADGKQTTYTFGQGGSGTVVGTNGNSYPMRWQNDSHMGSEIIVINHQDGAQSWIPGHIRDPQD